MLIKTGGGVPFLLDPTPTAQKRLLAFTNQRQQQRSVVGMDVAAMRRAAQQQTNGGHGPWRILGSFRAPKDCTKRIFEDLYATAAKKFIRRAEQEGLELYTGYKPVLELLPGQNPAIDALTNRVLLDEREVIIRAWFTCRKPDMKAGIELPVEIFEPLSVGPTPREGMNNA